MASIRLPNSDGGYWDVALGTVGQVLVSNGLHAAPGFEDLPAGFPARGFNMTADWERDQLGGAVTQDFGVGNFTAEFERAKAVTAGLSPHGPASYTNPADVPWTKRI